MADGKIEIDSEIKTNNLSKGLNELKTKLNGFGRCLSGLSNVANIVSGLTNGFKAVSVAITKVTEAISENIELSQKQTRAEIQLETASKNNPYLNDESVEKLKKYASSLQSISAIGDEELLPFMAQLAAAGRTQAEIQDIMSAAIDASASGIISLDSAVQSLNRSYSGDLGMLGRILPETKNLTEEQLKNGAAIESVRKAFSGMANEVTNTTGGWQKFKNALGDYKEILGKGPAKIQNAAGNFLAKFFEGITSAISDASTAAKNFKKELGFIMANNSEDSTVKTLEAESTILEERIQRLKEIKKITSVSEDDYINQLKAEEKQLKKNKEIEEKKIATEEERLSMRNNYLLHMEGRARNGGNEGEISEIQKEMAENNIQLKDLAVQREVIEKGITAQYERQKQKVIDATNAYRDASLELQNLGGNVDVYIADAEKRLAELAPKLKDLKASESEETEVEKRKKALDEATKGILIQREEYEKQKKTLEERASLMGEEVSITDLLSLKVQQYMTIWEKYGTLARTELEKLKTEINELSNELETSINIDDYLSQYDMGLKSEVEAAKELLDSLYKEELISYDDYIENSIKLEKALTQAIEEEAEKRKEKLLAVAGIVNDVINNMTQAMQQMSSLAGKRAEDEAKIQNAALEKQYAKGEISLEEYEKKKEEIEKDAAKEKYKADMWNWSAGLLQIGTSTAMAIMQSFAQLGPIAGGIMAGAIGTLGLAQLAVAVGNKPIPPSFETGGIVPGTSYRGDKIRANVNSGEMVITRAQQNALWKTIQSGNYGNGGVKIYNYDAGNNQVEARQNGPSLDVYIRGVTQAAMEDGSMNSSMKVAQSSFDGRKYYN